MQLNIMSIAGAGFGVEPSVADGYLVLRLTGTGDMAAVPPLRIMVSNRSRAHRPVTAKPTEPTPPEKRP